MAIDVSCACGLSFKAKDEHAGLRGKCRSCGAILMVPSPSHAPSLLPDEVSMDDLQEGLGEDRVGIEREADLTDVWNVLLAISKGMSATNDRLHEYKVITQKDKWFSGKFDPEKVEGALNSYAKQGWVLKGVATASVPGFGGQRDEIVIIMER